jgi:uncharacterized protein
MDYRQGNIGRVFWVRMDDRESITDGIRELAEKENVAHALILALGGLNEADLVVGPLENEIPPNPQWAETRKAREMIGIGTVAPGPDGPSIHMHVGAGRGDELPVIGCLRGKRSQAYLVTELMIVELMGLTATREMDPIAGLTLLKYA